MKKYLIIIALSLVSIQSWALIQYKLKYNPTTDMFEVFYVSTVSYATVANVGPSQATIAFDPSYNTTAIVTTSLLGGAWLAQDKVTGTSGTLATKKVVGFQTSGAPIVGGATAGTEYKIFTFTFGLGLNCGAGTLRLWVNGVDPTDPNGAGGDFTSFLNVNSTDFVSTNNNTTFQNCVALTPLPVRFLSFTATKSGNNAILNWNVASEDAQTHHYEIERSVNRIDFTSIVTVGAKNNGSSNNTYDLTDPNLSALRSTVIYYRVKQVDADGRFVYSEIRALRMSGNGFGINLYPNPAKDYTNVTIELPDDSPLALYITDAAGKEVRKIEMAGFKGTNQKRIVLSGMASGTYLVKVHAGDLSQTISLVKAQ